MPMEVINDHSGMIRMPGNGKDLPGTPGKMGLLAKMCVWNCL